MNNATARYPESLTSGRRELDHAALAFLARRAQKVYQTEDEVRAALETKGGRLVRWWDVGTCEAFLVVFGEDQDLPFAVLAFRGTETRAEPADILVDVDFRKVALRGFGFDMDGKAHHGFLANLAPLVDDIAFRCVQMAVPVYVAGHSKGGAEAVLAAVYAAQWRGWNCPAVCTIGAPRVLDAEAAASFQASGIPHYRVVRAADPVPLVPPWHWGFRHDCDPIYIDRDGQVGTPGLAYRLFDRVVDIGLGLLKAKTPVNNHDAEGYCQALERAAAGDAA